MKKSGFLPKLEKPIADAFTLFKSVASFRPCPESECESQLQEIELEFLRIFEGFGSPVGGLNQHFIIYCREVMGQLMVAHMAYAGSPAWRKWISVFDLLHAPPTTENVGQRLDSSYRLFLRKRYTRYEGYLGKLDKSGWYARYQIYYHVHQEVETAAKELKELLNEARTKQGSLKWPAHQKAGEWIAAPGGFGNKTMKESSGGAFLRLTEEENIREYRNLAQKMVNQGHDGSCVSRAEDLIRMTRAMMFWMRAFYEVYQAIVEIQRYKYDPKGPFDLKFDREVFGSTDTFQHRIYRRFERAYELVNDLCDGAPQGWEFSYERQMATCLVSRIAWLFRDLKESVIAEHYEWLYVQRFEFYPDDEFSWNERMTFFEESNGYSLNCGGSAREAVENQNKNTWLADRRRKREEIWRTVRQRRPRATQLGPPPQAQQRNEPPSPERQAQIQREHLLWVFNNPLSSWETRQDAIHSPSDCYLFFTWLQEKFSPNDGRRRARLNELIDGGRQSRQASRSMCRAIVQIYHPDSNVNADERWRELAEQITRVPCSFDRC